MAGGSLEPACATKCDPVYIGEADVSRIPLPEQCEVERLFIYLYFF
jgi:hypothetical protein